MANSNIPKGFIPSRVHPYYEPHKWTVAGSQAIAVGDMVALNSDGRVALYADTTIALILGVAASPVAATAAVGDEIWVFDNPLQVFEGQCSGNGALANAYTCGNSLAACFDMEGATGVQQIDENSTTNDIIHVVGGVPTDVMTGQESAVGANQRKFFRINTIKHAFKFAAS